MTVATSLLSEKANGERGALTLGPALQPPVWGRAPERLVRGPRGPQSAPWPPVAGKDTCWRGGLAGLRAGGGRDPCRGALQTRAPVTRHASAPAASGGLSRAAKCRPRHRTLGERGLRGGLGMGQAVRAAHESPQGGACQAEETREVLQGGDRQ